MNKKSKVNRLPTHKERADGTACGTRLGLPRSQRGNPQRYGMQIPPQPLKQHRSHCSQSPAHHGRQRCNQLLKHLNAHAKGSLQNQVQPSAKSLGCQSDQRSEKSGIFIHLAYRCLHRKGPASQESKIFQAPPSKARGVTQPPMAWIGTGHHPREKHPAAVPREDTSSCRVP